MSRAAAKAQTLQKLRTAGREVLLELGVQRTSISDITSRAKLAIGTFYVHFPTKADLVDSLVDELNAGLASRMMAVFLAPPLPPPREIVDALARVVIDYWFEHAKELPLLTDYVARHADQEILQVGTNARVVALVRALVTAQPGLELRTTPDFLVTTLVSLWRGGGRLAAAPDRANAEQRDAIARDVATATKALLDVFVPGLLDADATVLVTTALSALGPSPLGT